MSTDGWFPALERALGDVASASLDYLPRLLAAALLLLIGWGVARLLRSLTRRSLGTLQRLRAGRTVSRELQDSETDRFAVEATGLVVFWLVFVAFLATAVETLGLTIVTTGLNRLILYLPNVLGAVLVMVAGVVIANVARRGVLRAASSTGLAFGAELARAARAGVLTLAAIVALGQLGVDSELLVTSTNILIASVIGGAALAFALGSKTAVANILALHYVAQTYEPGQRVRVGDLEGEIVAFKKNAVLLSCADGLVLVPASEFSERRSTLVTRNER